MKRACLLCLLVALAWACPFDMSLREFLHTRFWLPFVKSPAAFEKPNVRRVSEPFAGMTKPAGEGALGRLRTAYQAIAAPQTEKFDLEPYRRAVEAARAEAKLTAREREEVELIDAKVELRAAQPEKPDDLQRARKKLEAFLRSSQTPAYLSEARGWLARVHYLLGDQTAAGKLYLDELNKTGSNLSRQAVMLSLEQTYRYDGGKQLRDHLEDYFDTPEHAAFALQLVTNPHWHTPDTYPAGDRATQLLESHKDLLRSGPLTLLAMRTALYAGDLAAARRLGEAANAEVRADPDFLWMLASAHYLAHDFARAEAPLKELFHLTQASVGQRAAAAYGLCGVYWKTGNELEQLRYALWLRRADGGNAPIELGVFGKVEEQSVYWAASGWDLNLLLEFAASVETLRKFIEENPKATDLRLVQYSLAVRLARENRYQEAADLYATIGAVVRAPRMRRMAALYAEVATNEGKYKFAEFLEANADRIYFNDLIWYRMQSYVFQADTDERLTGAERAGLLSAERKLKDDQEERWRAYLLLREVMRDEGRTELGRRAAALGLQCLRGMSERFGRGDELRAGMAEMYRWR